MQIKVKIQNRFNKASLSYDKAASAQKEAAEFLVNRLIGLQIVAPETVLDLGTGTGYVSELLLKSFPNAQYTLNDIAEEMLEFCKYKFSHLDNVNFLTGDMSELNIGHYNLIVSNFAFQWLENLDKLLESFNATSKIFAFSTLLEGTFCEWYDLVGSYEDIKFRKFPKEAELVEICEKTKGSKNFYYWVQTIQKEFDSTQAFLKYLKALGASACEGQMSSTKLRILMNKKSGKLIILYKIFFGIFK